MASTTFVAIKFILALAALTSFQQYLTSARPLHTTSHYSFFEGNPKWEKYDLTYAFGSNAPLKNRPPIASAFQIWASVSKFKFTEVQDFKSADIKIQFLVGQQAGKGEFAFDGPLGVLAQGYAPVNKQTDLHFDATETWTTGGADKNGHDMQTVALHEIGHCLGLFHSDLREALMYAVIEPGQIKGIHDEDIQGLKALYNW